MLVKITIQSLYAEEAMKIFYVSVVGLGKSCSVISINKRHFQSVCQFVCQFVLTKAHYQVHHYTWPGSCIKTALSQATVASPGPVNWGVVYPKVTSPAALGPKIVFQRRSTRT